MAKKPREEAECGNWMDTYGDMVTLLLTFFVMLFSMSSVNEEKFAKLVKAFTSRDPNSINIIIDQTGEGEEFPMNRGEDPPTQDSLANITLQELEKMVPDNFNDLYEYLRAYTEKSGMMGSVEVSRAGEGVVFIRFQDNIFFEPDSATLRSTSRPILEFLGNCLKGVESQLRTVNINGHTADPGIQNYPISDWVLSSERAANMAIYLEEEKKLPPQKLLPIGYGKNFPVEDNATPEGQESNRRVDMLIISTDSGISAQSILSSILEGTFDTGITSGEGNITDVMTPQNNIPFASSQSSGSETISQSENSQADIPVNLADTELPVSQNTGVPEMILGPEN